MEVSLGLASSCRFHNAMPTCLQWNASGSVDGVVQRKTSQWSYLYHGFTLFRILGLP